MEVFNAKKMARFNNCTINQYVIDNQYKWRVCQVNVGKATIPKMLGNLC